MKAKLEVIRINEDVIATSLVSCDGKTHYKCCGHASPGVYNLEAYLYNGTGYYYDDDTTSSLNDTQARNVNDGNEIRDDDICIKIVSGTDRDVDRVTMDHIYHIPYYQIIGTDCYNEGSHHDDVDYLEYQYDNDEKVMRDSTRIIKNVKSSKIMQMYQEIGQKPVLAFGNSSGDQSMFTFTATNEKYKTAVFCLVPDDNDREYASESKVSKLTKLCQDNNYNVISMKDDFLTIYGENVKKNPNNLTLTNKLLANYNNE